MYLFIIFLPLIGTIVAGLFGSKIGIGGAKQITISCITTTFFLSCFAFYEVGLAGSPCYIELFN
jgi:NADH-ubiquinone oxidoreductase chain 5